MVRLKQASVPRYDLGPELKGPVARMVTSPEEWETVSDWHAKPEVKNLVGNVVSGGKKAITGKLFVVEVFSKLWGPSPAIDSTFKQLVLEYALSLMRRRTARSTRPHPQHMQLEGHVLHVWHSYVKEGRKVELLRICSSVSPDELAKFTKGSKPTFLFFLDGEIVDSLAGVDRVAIFEAVLEFIPPGLLENPPLVELIDPEETEATAPSVAATGTAPSEAAATASERARVVELHDSLVKKLEDNPKDHGTRFELASLLLSEAKYTRRALMALHRRHFHCVARQKWGCDRTCVRYAKAIDELMVIIRRGDDWNEARFDI